PARWPDAAPNCGLRRCLVPARGRRLWQVHVEQLFHVRVAALRTLPAHDDSDDAASTARRGGCEVETRGADVACLQAIDARHSPEKIVVPSDHLAGVGELAIVEIVIVVREALTQGDRQDRHVARGGALPLVWQT